jgi:hypothetical protein
MDWLTKVLSIMDVTTLEIQRASMYVLFVLLPTGNIVKSVEKAFHPPSLSCIHEGHISFMAHSGSRSKSHRRVCDCLEVGLIALNPGLTTVLRLLHLVPGEHVTGFITRYPGEQ